MFEKVKGFVSTHKMQMIAGGTAAAAGLSTVAFAETPDTTVAVSAVTGAMGDAFAMVGTVLSQIASQPILLLVLAASFIPIGVKVFRMLKHAVK